MMSETEQNQSRRYRIFIESSTVYAFMVDASDHDEAEEKAWQQWREDASKAEWRNSTSEMLLVEECSL